MQLIEVPAKSGYVWFRQGIWLFRRNPVAFITLSLTWMLFALILGLVPVVGAALPLLFVPGIVVGFMAACRNTVGGQPVLPPVLIEGFRAHGSVIRQRLFTLGGIYLVAVAAVLACSALADGGTLLSVTFGLGLENGDTVTVVPTDMALAMLLSALLYVPVAMLFWFAPVLVAWHEVPPAKAIFFSVVSCWRNRSAFLLFALLWLAVGFGASFAASAVMALLGLASYVVQLVLPIWVVLGAAFYCSAYATYRGCFGVQEPGGPGAAPPKAQ